VHFRNSSTVQTPNSNIKIYEGIFSKYYDATIPHALGTGGGQLQILGGKSGFAGNRYLDIKINNSTSYEVDWGSAFFNPSILVLTTANVYGEARFHNPLDLNGTNRTVSVDIDNLSSTGYGSFESVIRNSGGSSAGLIKIGPGRLLFKGVNTYDGDTWVNQGVLEIQQINTNNESSTITIADTGATLTLNYVGSDEVKLLMIGSLRYFAGEYGHSDSGADNGGLGVGALDAYFGAGTGKLLVTGMPAGTVITVE
jgi:autotransporter-associated beta strand protein